MKVTVYNQTGEAVGEVSLAKEIFGLKVNSDLVYQVVKAAMANQRKTVAHAKDRSEVRGGGRKPWRQKGTGRARHGSRRSPIWIGGGVTFGPRKERVFKEKVNKKMRRKALKMVLSAKVESNLLVLLDQLKLEKAKTQELAKVMEKLPNKGKNTLLAITDLDQNIIRAGANLPGVKVMQVKELNVLDLLSFKYLIIPQSAITVIKETFI